MRDPLVQSVCAVVFGAAMLWFALPGAGLAAGVLSVPMIQVAITDFRTRYVYTVYALAGLVLGIVLSSIVHEPPAWTANFGAFGGIFVALIGALGGALVFGLLYGIGFLIFKVEAMARGDITIAAMVGAGAAACTPQALLYGVLFGGLFGALTLVFRRKLGTFMPYGPGLCLGGLVTLFLC
jgi:prepilin signal peptidase PulO-like enzyme (type II secretory pathway)